MVLATLGIFRACGGGGCDMAKEAVKVDGSYNVRLLYRTCSTRPQLLRSNQDEAEQKRDVRGKLAEKLFI